jgi:NAD(P)-dependent dehydrogenase (short-subunit alcohol dehydrogenase family)
VSSREIAVVVGAGAGLGNALVERFAEAGMRVAAVSRRGGMGESHGGPVRSYSCDATVGEQVTRLFERVTSELGPPSVVVFNVGIWDRGEILNISEELFEQAWRTGCFAGFLVGRAAAASMSGQAGGTIIFFRCDRIDSRRRRIRRLRFTEICPARAGAVDGTRTWSEEYPRRACHP